MFKSNLCAGEDTFYLSGFQYIQAVQSQSNSRAIILQTDQRHYQLSLSLMCFFSFIIDFFYKGNYYVMSSKLMHNYNFASKSEMGTL